MQVWTIWAISAVAILAANLAPVSAADKPKDLIVGKWEAKPDDASIAIEFTKDGKMKIVVTKGDKSRTVEGSYTLIDDETIEVVLEAGGEKVTQKMKIIKLTQNEFSATDEKNSTKTFKRVK